MSPQLLLTAEDMEQKPYLTGGACAYIHSISLFHTPLISHHPMMSGTISEILFFVQWLRISDAECTRVPSGRPSPVVKVILLSLLPGSDAPHGFFLLPARGE